MTAREACSHQLFLFLKGSWKSELKKFSTKFLKTTDGTNQTRFGLKAGQFAGSCLLFTNVLAGTAPLGPFLNPSLQPAPGRRQTTPSPGTAKKCLTRAPQNCQGRDKQGKTEKLSQVRGHLKDTTKYQVGSPNISGKIGALWVMSGAQRMVLYQH